MKKDTAAAISTGMTNSGIGIIRISGPEAVHIADRIYKGRKRLSEAQSHTIHYGHIVEEGEQIDEVLVSVFLGPRTFTGEDTVEINCHGGIYVTGRVFEAVLKAGARTAEPGEFTKRAFLNGRIDLSQAEAVMDVISSKNEYALKSSISQLKGSIKNKIISLRNEIIYNIAYIESSLDDPEHISLDGYSEKLREICKRIESELEKLIASSEDGKIMTEGIQTVILGKPNAGKSSLLNVLAGYERAIVTEIEGTTRDALEEKIRIRGLNLNLVDTAGIRMTEDLVEKLGVEKAEQYAREADLVIYVVDSTKKLDQNDRNIMKMIQGKKAVVLLNKSDLDGVLSVDEITEALRSEGVKEAPVLTISAKEEEGIREFEDLVENLFFHGKISFNDQIYITNARQKQELDNARKSMENVRKSIDLGMPEDFYSIDLMDAYEALGAITGETTGEDLVNEIFSRFCMGK